jgi:hypothetical protein
MKKTTLLELLSFASELEKSITTTTETRGSFALNRVPLTAEEQKMIAETAIPPTGYVLYVPSQARKNLERALSF